MKSLEEGIRSCELFSELPASEVAWLAENVCVRSYRKSTIILSAGDTTDSVHIVVCGKVRVFRDNEAGRQFILNTLAPGSMFGELAAISDSPRMASIETMESTKTIIIEKSVFMGLLSRNPQVSIAISRKLAILLQVMSDNMAELALLDVYGRLTNFLERSAVDRGGKKVVAGYTHQELANCVGASREMISRILGSLKKGKYISAFPEIREIVLEQKLPVGW